MSKTYIFNDRAIEILENYANRLNITREEAIRHALTMLQEATKSKTVTFKGDSYKKTWEIN